MFLILLINIDGSISVPIYTRTTHLETLQAVDICPSDLTNGTKENVPFKKENVAEKNTLPIDEAAREFCRSITERLYGGTNIHQ